MLRISILALHAYDRASLWHMQISMLRSHDGRFLSEGNIVTSIEEDANVVSLLSLIPKIIPAAKCLIIYGGNAD